MAITMKPRGALVVVSIWALTACATEALGAGKPVPESEIPAVLAKLSQANKKIWDRTKTWQGSMDISSTRHLYGRQATLVLDYIGRELTVRPKEFTRTTLTKVTFAVDLEADRLYSNYRSHSDTYTDAATSKPLKVAQPPFRQVSIVTPDEYLFYEPGLAYAGQAGPDRVGRATGFRTSPDKAEGREWSTIVDPRTMLKYEKPIWENLDLIIKRLKLHGSWEVLGHQFSVSVSGEKGHEEYQLVLPGLAGPGTCRIMYQTFRADVGYNITSLIFAESDGSVRHKLTWDYTEIEKGHFLPSRLERISRDVKNKRVRSVRVMTIGTSDTIRPIAKGKFTLQALGMKDGDRFIDKTTRTVYTHKAGKLTEISQGLSDEQLDDIYGTIMKN